MKYFFNSLIETIKIKKGYFIFLCIVTILAIAFGVYAGISFSDGAFVVNLNNISYISYLKEECGFLSLIFKMILGLILFFAIILFCGSKTFLLPLKIIFYIYFVYSQTVLLVSLIILYGFLNCLILSILLLFYYLIIIAIFMLAMLEMACYVNDINYFKCCFANDGKIWVFLIALLLTTILFAILLTLLKSFVIILVF